MSELNFPVQSLADQLSAGTHPIRDIAALRRTLQGAISLEFSVIAPCMTALWSIREPDHEVAGFIHDRVFQRLARAYQLSNLLLSIGGVPKFTAVFTPVYPSKLLATDEAFPLPVAKLGAADRDFYTRLMPMLAQASVARMPAPGKPVQTSGQFYLIIEKGLVFLEEQAQQSGETIFDTTPGYRQKERMGYGVEGYALSTITNLIQAHEVLRKLLGQIQGGVAPLPAPLARLALGKEVFPEVWPLAEEGDAEWSEEMRSLSALFDSCYSQLLRVLERSFETDERLHQRYLDLAPVLMRDLLPVLARLLMSSPVQPGADVHGVPQWRYSLTSPQKSCELLARLQANGADCDLLRQALHCVETGAMPLAESA